MTEKKGGIDEAKKTFEKLTGEKVPDRIAKPGDRYRVVLEGSEKEVQIRIEGNSGHPKIEITDYIQKILEKVSFK